MTARGPATPVRSEVIAAEPGPASPAGRGYRRPDIQGLRAVAVLMVVAFHSGLPVPGGFVGVDVFFVISGFVITLMLQREWSTTGRIRFGRFYLRRFLRLTPALALMVTVTTAVSVLLLSPTGTQQTEAKTAIGATTLVANAVIARTTRGYFDAPAATNPLLHTWSLSVEEQFYLVFPALLAVGWFAGRRIRGRLPLAVPVVAAVAVGSFVVAVLGSRDGSAAASSWIFGYYSPASRAWEFAAGALVALLGVGRVPGRRAAAVLGLVGAVLLGSCLLLIDGATPFPGVWTLLPVAGTGALLLAGRCGSNPVSRALSVRPMVRLGDWSYSIYLWHWPLICFTALVAPGRPLLLGLAAAACLLPALVSVRFVERPLRTVRGPGLRQLAVMAVLAIGLPLGTAGLLATGARHGWGVPVVQEMRVQALTAHVGWQQCLSQAPNGGAPPADPAACRFGSAAPGPPVFLVGDSNAAVYSEAVIGAAQRLSRPVTMSTAAGCPFLDVYRSSVRGVSSGDRACRDYYDSTLALLIAHRGGTAVIGESTGYWTNPDLVLGSAPGTGSTATASRSATLTAGLRATVTALHDAGLRVVLVEPAFVFDDPSSPVSADSCTMLSMFRGTCPRTVSIDQVDPAQLTARADVREVARRSGAMLVDVTSYQCPDGRCSAYYGHTPLYLDRAHFSARLSELLVPDFQRALLAGR